MTQQTLVLKLSRAEGQTLRSALGPAYEFRSVPHAAFSAKGDGVVVTLYTSGKLVVQGAEPELFTERYLGRGAEAGPAGATGAPAVQDGLDPELLKGPLVGSDETGKGDWFGPLVVAAVRLEAQDAKRLEGGGVMDSKQLSDDKVRAIGPALRERYEHAIEILNPPEYNARHAETKNLNPMLAELHARAIRRVARPGVPILVDKFANERLMREALADVDAPLHQAPRAERAMAVAAASIIAREAFLDRLAELSLEFAVDLRKGAGSPTDRAGREFLELHSRERLGEVAKLHFKNTSKLP